MRSGEPDWAPVCGVSAKRTDEILERCVSVGEPLISPASDVTTRRFQPRSARRKKKKNPDRLVKTVRQRGRIRSTRMAAAISPGFV
jgi:hypothetical protein